MPLLFQLSEGFIINLTHGQFEAPDSDNSPNSVEKHKARAATIINDSKTPRRAMREFDPNETTLESPEDTKNTTLIESTPPPVLPPPSDSPTMVLHPSASTRAQSRNASIELEEFIPSTQTPATKAQGERRLTKALAPPETLSKSLQMLVDQSPSSTAKKPNGKSSSGKSSSISNGSGTPTTSDLSPVAGRKRLRNENHEAHNKGPEPVLTTPTPSRLVIPPAQPRAKRPRYERSAAPKRVPNEEGIKPGKKSPESVSRTTPERNDPKDIKPCPAVPEPQYPAQIRIPSPTAAGPKRKRAPTKRG